jgi:shikimate kinase
MKIEPAISPRVDFLGPSGVGKTTLCQAVLEDLQAPWVGMAEARIRARNQAYRHVIPRLTPVRRVTTCLRQLLHIFTYLLLRGDQRPLFNNGKVDILEDDLFDRILQSHHGLIEALADDWFDPDMELPSRAKRYDEMLRWCREWLFTIHYAGPVSILADNSRLTRGMAEILSNPERPDAQQLGLDYLASPLSPQAIIHLTATPEEIVQRIKTREQAGGVRNSAHRGLNDEALLAYSCRRLQVNSAAVAFFATQELPTLEINASARHVENGLKVRAFLNEVIHA